MIIIYIYNTNRNYTKVDLPFTKQVKSISDNIPKSILRQLAIQICKILKKNIFKKGDSTVTSNYRPICCLPIMSLLFENILSNCLIHFLQSNNLISKDQFGFLPSRSTTVHIAYIDFAKAFDTVQHILLLIKFKAYGISGSIIYTGFNHTLPLEHSM